MKKIFSFMLAVAALSMVACCGGNKKAAEAEATAVECCEECCEKCDSTACTEECCEECDSTACTEECCAECEQKENCEKAE